MIDMDALRDRLSEHEAAEQSRSGGDRQDPDPEGQLPFAHYDRLDAKQVIAGLSDHSQVELEAVETYERSHEGREGVLDKLRYMRGREPLPGYDALDVEEIVAALGQADLRAIKRVRGYERKFANRPAVLEEVARVHKRHRAAHPAGPTPKYQPLSASSAPSRSDGGDPGGARP